MERLTFNRSRCTGCRYCESICVFNKEGTTFLTDSRVQVYVRNVEDQTYQLNVCRLCKKCPPLEVCPVQAITRDQETGIIHIDNSKCPDGCRMCVDACPLNAIFLGTQGVIVCDLCGGDPVCVKFCEPQALTLSLITRAFSDQVKDYGHS